MSETTEITDSETPKITAKVKTRILCVVKILAMAAGLLNLWCSARGYACCITFDSNAVTQTITLIYTAIVAMWGFWKNFSWTETAQKSDTLLKALKGGDTSTITTAYTTIETAYKDVKSLISEIGAIGSESTDSTSTSTNSTSNITDNLKKAGV